MLATRVRRVQPDPFALPAFILATISLVVATIGALTGIVALVWQIITRTRGAHRVTVSVANSVLLGPGSPDGVIITVEAINSGASAVQITGWGFELPNKGGGIVATIPMRQSAALPHMLLPGTNVDFFMPATQLGHALREQGLSSADYIRAYVKLATGEKVFPRRRGVPLHNEFLHG